MKLEGTNLVEDDSLLVRRVLEGEASAFDTLTHRYLGRCYRIARRFGLSHDDAADVVQDTFLAAFRSLTRFNFDYHFSSWLTRIHVNRLLNFRRGRSRAKKFFLKPHREPIKIEYLASDNNKGPDKALENSELQLKLIRCIDALPKNQRLAFILFELEDYKIKEIAEMLQVPEGTVNSRLHHARLALRQQLRHFL